MKYSRAALGMLNAQYKSVLKKCILLNLGMCALALPALANGYDLKDGDKVILTANTSIVNDVPTESSGRKTAILAAGDTSISTGDYTLTVTADQASARNYIFNTVTAGTDFKFTGNLDATDIGTGSSDNRGIRTNAKATLLFDGSVKVGVFSDTNNAIAVDIWGGSEVTFKGKLTDLKTEKSSGYYSYGVQIYEDAGAVANFEAEQTNISVKGGNFANAVFVNGGSVNIKGDANLSAQNTTGRARVIALESNPSPVHDSYVSLSGNNIALTSSTVGNWDAWGIYASGFTCTVDINSQNLTIDVSSERIAHGLTSQFSGTVHLYSGTVTTINATSEDGSAIGIEASWWDGSAGKIISEGELNVTAQATTAIAVGSSNTGSFTANKINAKALGENAKAVDVSNGATLTIKQLNAKAQGTTWATALNINDADSVVVGTDDTNTVLSSTAEYGAEGVWLSGGEAELKGNVSVSAEAEDFAWGVSLSEGTLTTDDLTVSASGDYANALYLSDESTLNLNGKMLHRQPEIVRDTGQILIPTVF